MPMCAYIIIIRFSKFLCRAGWFVVQTLDLRTKIQPKRDFWKKTNNDINMLLIISQIRPFKRHSPEVRNLASFINI